MIVIDGSAGEGGGQMLRTALSLSLVTGKPFRIDDIRARRSKPGLLRQHLTAVSAAVGICEDAEVEGAELGSQSLSFYPGTVKPGEYAFDVGSAGSANLVLQTILPPLLVAGGPSRISVDGGTHNPTAPPFEFLARTFLPIVERMGPRVTLKLQKAGFYPAGGGRLSAEVTPAKQLAPIELRERGKPRTRLARAVVSNLPRAIGQREVGAIERELGLEPEETRVDDLKSPGPGNVVQVELAFEHLTKVFTGFGVKGTPAEVVAGLLVERVKAYQAGTAVAGEFLTDQLLLPFALAGGGTFSAMQISSHARTNMTVIEIFLGTSFTVEAEGGRFSVRIGPRNQLRDSLA